MKKIRITMIVEGGGHTNQNGIHFFEFGKIAGGPKHLAIPYRFDQRVRDVFDITLALIERGYFIFVDVKTDGFDFGFGELADQGQTHITQANDANANFVIENVLKFHDLSTDRGRKRVVPVFEISGSPVGPLSLFRLFGCLKCPRAGKLCLYCGLQERSPPRS